MKINPQLQSVLDKHFGKEMSSLFDKVVIVTAYKLQEDEIQAILAKFPDLKGDAVENIIEPEILGGFIIKHGSKLVDLSLLTQLQTVKQKLYEE